LRQDSIFAFCILHFQMSDLWYKDGIIVLTEKDFGYYL